MDKKIKIAHVLHAVGGVDVYLRLLTENLSSSAFENIIIHGENDSTSPYTDSNNKRLKNFSVPIQREISVVKDIKAIISTVKIFKKEKPQVVHAHSAKGGIIARAASLFYPVKVLHTPHAYSFLSAETKIKKKLFIGIERVFKNFNSWLLATSNSERQLGIDVVGYSQEKALVFNNSVLPIEDIPELGIQKTWPKEYICSVGRPSFQKNIELMLDVLHLVRNEMPEIHLVLMGVGLHSPNLEAVKQKIEVLNLSKNITLLEWTKREDIFHIISSSKLYISTARYEGLPYSMIESLALGKAMVVTNCDGNRDLVINEDNGFVINDNNEVHFSEGIITLLNDNDLRLKFEQSSLAYFNENFNLNSNIHKLGAIYKKMI